MGVIQSLQHNHVWKITDFMFPPVILLGHGLKLPQYHSLETLLSLPVNCFPEGDNGSAWPVGCILYELCTGRPAFPEFSTLLKFEQSGFEPDYTLIGLNSKLSGVGRTLEGEEKVVFSAMWNFVHHMSGLSGSVDSDQA